MASYFRRKKSPFYWLRVKRPDGSWGNVSSGIRLDDPFGARKIGQRIVEETAREACVNGETGAAIFNRWVPHWFDYRYKNEWSKVRCVNAWANLGVFFAFRGITHPAEITYAVCHEYVRWRTKPGERKPAGWNTAVMEVRVLGAVMQEALRRGFVPVNPCGRLGLAKQEAKGKRAITRAEEAMIFEKLAAKPQATWMYEAFLVAMRQGCRLREVQVPMERIDTRNMVITFKVKGGRLHSAPLHPDLLRLVKKAQAEKRPRLVELPKAASPRWWRFFHEVGLPDVCFHCTRVTVVTRLCEAGFSESQTMAYVGHASELVHALYRKMRPSAVAALCAAL